MVTNLAVCLTCLGGHKQAVVLRGESGRGSQSLCDLVPTSPVAEGCWE